MARRSRRSNPTYTFVALVLISFVMMSFDINRSTDDGIAGRFRAGAAALFGPIQQAVDTVTDPIFGFVDSIASLATLRQQNDFLVQTNEELELRIADAARLEAENEQLRLLLDLEVDTSIEVGTEVADVIAFVDNVITIDKGLSDGVVVGNPVLNQAKAPIGRVTQATENQATVTLLTHMTDAVRITTPGGVTGLITGSGRSDQLLFEVTQEAELIPAGTFFTTAGGLFPRNLVIGHTDVDLVPDGDQITGFIIPEADFTRSLNFVVVLLYTENLDADDEEASTPTTTTSTTVAPSEGG